jgi:iron(III) transport system permease protein
MAISARRQTHWLMAAGLYLFFALFLIWPIVQVVSRGFGKKGGGITFAYIGLIFQSPILRQGLANAAAIAIAVTVLSLAIALPLSILSVRYDFPGRGILTGLLLVPLVLPPFVGALGMRLILGRLGPLSVLFTANPLGIDWLGRMKIVGIIIVEALHLYPIMLLNLQAALANIDPAMEQAAANLGASGPRIFRKITLPLIRPGLFAGCTLVLIWSFTELGTPLMFDYYTVTPVQIFHQLTDVADNPLPYALVVVTLFASTLLYLIGKVLLGRGFDAATTKATTAASSAKITGLRGFLCALPFLIIFLLAVLPHISVILTSLSGTGAWYKTILPSIFTTGHFKDALRDELAFPSIVNSIEYALIATIIAVVVGLSASVIIVRSDLPGKQLIDALAMLPLAVPGLILAFGYLAISISLKQKWPALLASPNGPLRWLDVQEHPLVLLVLAYAARRLPYVVRSAAAGLEQTPRDLELAGANLGASRWTVMRKITVPLIFANLIAGALLAFAFAVLEVSDSLILAQRASDYPITKAILDLSQRLGDGLYIASALGVWAMALLTLTILAANAFLGKKMGAIFRV